MTNRRIAALSLLLLAPTAQAALDVGERAPDFVAPAALVPFGSFHNDDHTIKAGINYRFNLGGPALTRY